MSLHCTFLLARRVLVGAAAALPIWAHAHGALVDYRVVQGVTLQARYEAGDPMTMAQVTVYAPNNPSQPWLTGKTDQQGRFSFVPDPALPGLWAVQAGEAGHGAMVQVTIDNDGAAATSAPAPQAASAAQSAMQRWLMGAAIVWGFVGTGLFFARRKPR